MEKPLRAESDAPAKAQEVINKFEKCSRDHMLTFMNEDVCIAICKNWSAIDAGLNQAMKDMAKPVSTNESQINMNAILVAASQLISRMHELAEQGAGLITTVETKKV